MYKVDLFECLYGMQVKYTYKMKIIVAVVVYDRFNNIERWINCWQQSNTKNAELVIVHNYYGNTSELEKFKRLCDDNKITYVPRNAAGFDIGAFQDVCRERLQGFPDFDYLLWCTDDTFPMSKDFITSFIDKIKEPGVGVSCMQLSSSVSAHVRTSGFCISKEISKQITFPADPVTTKQHCYLFEHRGGNKTFTNQIRQMGLSCVQVTTIKESPLWDSDHPNLNKRLDRQQEFNRVWNIQSDKVVFICPVYDAFPQIISSLICQTNKNWELLLIHDGTNDLKPLIEGHADNRIKYIQRPRAEHWGHPLRQWALNEIKEGKLCTDSAYIVITNADNYYVPVFCEYMLKGFTNGQVAVYCDQMVHSYKAWDIIPCSLKIGFLDCGGVMVKKEVAAEIGWNSFEHSSDWTYFNDIIKKYGANKWSKVKGTLFVHN